MKKYFKSELLPTDTGPEYFIWIALSAPGMITQQLEKILSNIIVEVRNVNIYYEV